MSPRFATVTAVLAASCLLAADCPAGPPIYVLTELPTPAGTFSEAFGISESGKVAGYAGGPVIWDAGGIAGLGMPAQEGLALKVRAVNDAGQAAVVGEANPQAYQSFLWAGGAWTPIGSLPGLPDSIVEDIDSTGRIVGRSLLLGPGAPDRAFLWDDGVFTELGTLGGFSAASGLNEVGQVAGTTAANLPGGDVQLRGFLWDAGRMTGLEPLAGDVATQAFDVNDAGDVVGSSFNYTVQFLTTDQATLWRDGGVVDLGVVPAAAGAGCGGGSFWTKSIARAINNHGQVVGEAMCVTSGAPKAAFVRAGGVTYNLNDLVQPGTGLDLRSARDINDAGQIVGYAINQSSQLRAFLLTPVATCDADLDGDDVVGVSDFLALLALWGPCSGCAADLDGDGGVGVTDMLALLAAWGPCP